MEKSRTFKRLMARFDEARKQYMEIAKGAEDCHMMLAQYADVDDLAKIKEDLDEILMNAKDRLSIHDEYIEITSAAIALRNAVETTMLQSKYVSHK